MTTIRGVGHIEPLRPFADALRRDGHDVLIAVPESFADRVAAAGYATWPLAEAPADERGAMFARTAGATPEEANRVVVGGLFAGLDARAALPGVLTAVAEFRPDVLVHETMEFAAPLVGERGVVPTIHVSANLMTLEPRIIEWAAPAVDELRGELGLPGDPSGARLFARPALSLMPRALDPGSRAHHFRAPRPATAGRPGSGERPLVYLSFGSVAPQTERFPALYREAIEQLAPLPVRVLVTTGGQDPADLGTLPDHVRAERWVDERTLGASAMVSHGGAGSLREALTSGLPLVVVPLFGDQPYNARAVEASGAGIALDAGIGGLADAVAELLWEPGYRSAAASIAREVAELPPAADAVGIIAGAAAT